MIRAMVALHPRVFAIAVGGAAVFATCTVLSSVALRWVIDHIFVPRFDDGEVEAVDRGRRHHVRVRRRRHPLGGRRRSPRVRDEDPVPRRCVARSPGRRPARPATGVVAPAAPRRRPRRPSRRRHRRRHRRARPDPVRDGRGPDDRDLRGLARRHRRDPRGPCGHRVPDPDAHEHRLPASGGPALRHRPERAREAVVRRPRELRRRAARQGVRGRAPRDRAAVRGRRPAARRPSQGDPVARHVRVDPRRDAVADERRTRRRRRLPRAQRRRQRRRAVELRLPVHAARVPAADDRLRAVGDAVLAGRVGAGPRGARRTDRARPRGSRCRLAPMAWASSSATCPSRSPARPNRRSPTST